MNITKNFREKFSEVFIFFIFEIDYAGCTGAAATAFATTSSSIFVVSDFGLSSGMPSARAQT
jgi:hypothetical protein